MYSRQRRWTAAAVLTACSAFTVSAQAAVITGDTTTIVARTGQASPDGGPGTFQRFAAPTLNNVGQAGFLATLGGVGVDESNNGGVYRGDGRSPIVQIAREGQAPADGPGLFTRFGNTFNFQSQGTDFGYGVVLNDAGQAAFRGSLGGRGVNANNDEGFYRGDGSAAPTQLVREGQVPDSGPGVITGLGFLEPGFNRSGDALFLATLGGMGVDATNDRGLYRGDGVFAPIEIARKGQALASGPGVILDFNAALQSDFNSLGQTVFQVTLGGDGVTAANDEGIYLGDGTTAFVEIARKGQAPSGGTGTLTSLFPAAQLNDAGQVAYGGRVAGDGITSFDGEGIYLSNGTAAGTIEVARTGQAPASGPGTFRSFEGPFLNNAGQTAFNVEFSGSNVDLYNRGSIYRGDGAALTQIVRAGDAAPTSDGGFEGSFLILDEPILNDLGQIAFLAEIDLQDIGNPFGQFGIFFHDDALGLLSVARAGDALDGSTINSLYLSNGLRQPSGSVGLNNLGQVAYSYTLTDGRSGVAIWSSTPVPEPTSLALIGLTGMTLLRRRAVA